MCSISTRIVELTSQQMHWTQRVKENEHKELQINRKLKVHALHQFIVIETC